MSFSRPRRGREDEEQDGARVGGEGPTPAKRPRGCSCSCCSSRQETKDFYEGQIDILKKEMECMSKGFTEERKTFQREMQSFYQNSQLQLREQISEQSRRMQQLFRELFNTLIEEISATRGYVWKNSDVRASCHQSKTRTHRLKFENKCCNDKFSGHAIKADDGNPIKVAIYDGNDNRIITNGPLSSMQVKIVVLDGEFNKENKQKWSGDSFVQNIIHGRPGKPPLFAYELYIRLENGVANLCGVKFQDNVPSKKFRLGVMAADDSISENILEGISEPFTIKAGRGFPMKKHSSPSLNDPIDKLKKIAGVRKEKLEQKHINLVQDFLLFYNKDKNSLREACGNISDHDWDVLVEHALSCKPGDVLYSYCIPEMDATIFFDSLYNIIGAEFNGHYNSYEELNNTQKDLVEVSKKKAYDNLKVVHFDYEDKSSSQEHQVLVGDKGRNYLQGSCSMTHVPTLPDEGCYHGEVPVSCPTQESPHPRQRWVKIVSMVTTLHFWDKETKWTLITREMLSFPL